MAPALVHIGWHKTGTTSLQAAWSRTPGIRFLCGEVMPLVQAARRHGRAGDCAHLPQVTPLDQGEAPLVVSNEGLGIGYYRGGCTAAELDRLQRAAAELTHALLGEARILISVRSPAAWLRSVYNQAVKEEYALGYAAWLRDQRDFAARSFDLAAACRIWEARFGAGSVLVLPMELMSEDPERFAAVLDGFAGRRVCRADALRDVPHNRSLDLDGLRLARVLNRMAALFRRRGVWRNEEVPGPYGSALESLRLALRENCNPLPQELGRALRPLLDALPGELPGPCEAEQRVVETMVASLSCFLQDDFHGYREAYLAQPVLQAAR